jgi:hypothetical protein
MHRAEVRRVERVRMRDEGESMIEWVGAFVWLPFIALLVLLFILGWWYDRNDNEMS